MFSTLNALDFQKQFHDIQELHEKGQSRYLNYGKYSKNWKRKRNILYFIK